MRVEEKARDIAEYCGFSQGMCYSFESPKVFDKLLLPADSELRKTVTISNPLGEDFSVMRTISLNGILTSLSTNYNRRNKNVRLYELGNVYIPKALPLTDYPDERMQFTLGMYGDGDFFTMKGVVEEFLESVGMRKKAKYDPNAEKPFLHPGRQALIKYEDTVIGYLGEVHPDVADNYNIGTRVSVAVLDMPEVVPFASFDRKYEGIAKYPAVTRDISMVVPKEILAGDIVLSTRATMNGVDKTLLKSGCPTKFNFSWREDGMMILNLSDFSVGAMPFAISFKCATKIMQLNSWEQDEYPGDGWIKFVGTDGNVTTSGDDAEDNQEGSGARVDGYLNVNTNQIEFIVDYNMMNVRTETFLQTIDKTRIDRFKEEFAQYEKDLEEAKKDQGKA